MIADALAHYSNLPLARLRNLIFGGVRVHGVQTFPRKKSMVFLSIAEPTTQTSSPKAAAMCPSLSETLFFQSMKWADCFRTRRSFAITSQTYVWPKTCHQRSWWAIRLQAVDAALDRYDKVLTTVEELGARQSHIARLHTQLWRQSTMLALHLQIQVLVVSLVVLSPLDRFNKVLQAPIAPCPAFSSAAAAVLNASIIQHQKLEQNYHRRTFSVSNSISQ